MLTPVFFDDCMRMMAFVEKSNAGCPVGVIGLNGESTPENRSIQIDKKTLYK